MSGFTGPSAGTKSGLGPAVRMCHVREVPVPALRYTADLMPNRFADGTRTASRGNFGNPAFAAR